MLLVIRFIVVRHYSIILILFAVYTNFIIGIVNLVYIIIIIDYL